MTKKVNRTFRAIGVGTLAACCMMLGWQGQSSASTLVIDDYTAGGTANGACVAFGYEQCVHFNTFPPFVPNPLLTDTQTGFSETNVLGGSRQLDIAGSSLGTPPTNPATAGSASNYGVNPGDFLLIGNQGGVNSRGTATYDANGAGLNLGAGNTRDFDLGQFDFFEFLFTSQDQDARLTLTFVSDLGGAGEVTQSSFLDLDAFATGETERSVKFNLSTYNLIDFGDIDRISFAIEGTENDLDAQFELVQFNQNAEVPEGSALFGLGVFGLGVFGKKVIHKLISR